MLRVRLEREGETVVNAKTRERERETAGNAKTRERERLWEMLRQRERLWKVLRLEGERERDCGKC